MHIIDYGLIPEFKNIIKLSENGVIFKSLYWKRRMFYILHCDSPIISVVFINSSTSPFLHITVKDG